MGKTDHKILSWVGRNLTYLFALIFSILNLWGYSKLSPIIADIKANAKDIEINKTDINNNEDTLIRLMESISNIKSDVSFIRGKLE